MIGLRRATPHAGAAIEGGEHGAGHVARGIGRQPHHQGGRPPRARPARANGSVGIRFSSRPDFPMLGGNGLGCVSIRPGLTQLTRMFVRRELDGGHPREGSPSPPGCSRRPRHPRSLGFDTPDEKLMMRPP